jgi:hypothetical protein
MMEKIFFIGGKPSYQHRFSDTGHRITKQMSARTSILRPLLGMSYKAPKPINNTIPHFFILLA